MNWLINGDSIFARFVRTLIQAAIAFCLVEFAEVFGVIDSSALASAATAGITAIMSPIMGIFRADSYIVEEEDVNNGTDLTDSEDQTEQEGTA